MDGPALSWYFSTVPRRGRPASKRAIQVAFHRTKYGRELLLDAAFVRQMPTFFRPGPHVLDFHDILLVTRGRGAFLLDGERHRVAPGVALFTLPGQVREWRVPAGLDGACLFFTREFVSETFSDPRFLDQFAYFAPERPSARLALGPPERRAFLGRFRAMQREIAALRDDAPEALRALLYEALVLLNRWYAARHGEARPAAPGGLVEDLRRLVERDFARRHRVADYAAELGISPGHLSARCRSRLRTSAGGLIRARITLEAKRLLLYTDLTAAQVADELGFDDAAYFARFLRREAGAPPSRLRLRGWKRPR
jgi:AraC-like DNA-binding protein